MIARRPPHQPQAGFTLLEILLALFVFAMVITLIYMTMGRSMTLVSRIEEQADLYAMARTTLLRIQDDVDAIPLLPPPREGEAVPLARLAFVLTDHQDLDEGHDSDSLAFISLADLPARGDTGQIRAPASMITYTAEKASDTTMTLFRTATPLGRNAPASPGDRAILCEQLVGIDFRATDTKGQEHPAWGNDTDPATGLPQRLTVTLRFLDPTVASGESRFMTSFLLPVSDKR